MLYFEQPTPTALSLRAEGIAVETLKPGTKALRILLLNLMPQKEQTERDVFRVLGHSGEDIAVGLMKMAGWRFKVTPQVYMETYYRDFDIYRNAFSEAGGYAYDGLIVTGAPLEHLEFAEVRYWTQLCEIMDWARTNVRSTLYICWAAQAALFHFYGVQKQALPAKCFGVFPQQVLHPEFPLMRGLAPEFPMPGSRHTTVRETDIPQEVSLVAVGAESGVGIAVSADGRDVYVTGHLEYAADTLANEYRRDLQKGLPILPPLHYYEADDPARDICFSWKKAAWLFYKNWLQGCKG